MAETDELDDLDLIDAEFSDEDLDAGDENALEAEIENETRWEEPAAGPVPRDVIFAEPVSDEFAEFLESLPQGEITTIIVGRLPDRNHAGEFRTRCTVRKHVDTVYWEYPKTAEEIYNEVRDEHGGGLYMFQIRQGRGFPKGKTWTAYIGDPAGPSKREFAATRQAREAKREEQPRMEQPSQVFVNQPTPATPQRSAFEEMRDRLKEAKEIRELLGISDDDRRVNETPHLSADEQIRLRVFDMVGSDPEFKDKLIDYGFGLFKRKEKDEESIMDLVKYAFKNPQESLGFIGGIMTIGRQLIFGPGGAAPTAMAMPPGLIPNMPPNVVPFPGNGVPGAPPAAPQTGLNMPAAEKEDVVTPATEAESQPQGQHSPGIALKKVEW